MDVWKMVIYGLSLSLLSWKS